jgi:putative transcriptional regulator
MEPNQIKTKRRRLGLNTHMFGLLVGVSGRTIESWEQGLRKPSGPAKIILQKLGLNKT